MGEGQSELRDRWERACGGAATTALRQTVLGQVLAAYTGINRFYHGIAHVTECLRELDAVRAQATNPQAIELAIWFHDVVYDGGRTDNEERSADVADQHLTKLGCAEVLRGDVRRLILLTRHDRVPPDIDGKLMVDIDLASLARPEEVFDENSRLIRQEFPHVPDAAFLKGRQEMLGRFLERPRVYYTQAFFDRYEKQARINLQRVLARSHV